MTLKRKIGTGSLALLVLLPSLNAVAQDFDAIEITAQQVAGNIYMLQGSGGNIGVSIGDDGTFIVDDQFAPLTDKIVAAIAELTNNPVDFVVNTHFHYDHTDGNENFGRAGAYIVAQDNSRKRMETDQVLASGRPQEAYDDVGLPKITFFDAMRRSISATPTSSTPVTCLCATACPSSTAITAAPSTA
jgi:cyclase